MQESIVTTLYDKGCGRKVTSLSHLADPGSVPGSVSFLVEVFSGVTSQLLRQILGNLGHIRPLYDHHL